MTAPELDVAAVQARLDAATPGPWEAHEDDASAFGEWVIWMPDAGCDQALVEHAVDAELIAHAPTDLRLLLEALKEARDRYDVLDQHAHSQDGLTDQIVDAEARASAAEAALVAERAAGIRIPRPAIHTGPKHLTINEATANYLRDAAQRVRDRRIWGSGVSALVASVLSDVAAALDGTDAEEADHG